MKPKLIASTVFSLLFAALLTAVSTTANAVILFEEDFEGYPVGNSASDKFFALWGGWQVATEGGNKFFRSVPYQGSDYYLSTVQQFSGNSTIEFMTRNTGGTANWGLSSKYINEANHPGDWDFYFWNGTDDSGAKIFGINSWWIDANGQAHNNASITLGTLDSSFDWTQWHDVKLTLADSVAQYYVDGTLLAAYDLNQVIPLPIDDFHLSWLTWGQKDLDNITVTSVPVPEPASLALLSLGLFGLGFSRRRKTRTAFSIGFTFSENSLPR